MMHQVLEQLYGQLRNKKVQLALVTICLALMGVAQTNPLYENLVFLLVGTITALFPIIHSPETEARMKQDKEDLENFTEQP